MISTLMGYSLALWTAQQMLHLVGQDHHQLQILDKRESCLWRYGIGSALRSASEQSVTSNEVERQREM